MSELDADKKRWLLHVLETARKGGMASNLMETLKESCGEIVLGASQGCVLKGIDPETFPWPCFIEHGSPIGEVWSLSQEVQKRSDAEAMPVRWVFNEFEMVAYPGNSHKILIDQWATENKRRENSPCATQKGDWKSYTALGGIATHQTAVLFEGGRRGGKTEAMKRHIEKARTKDLTLMEILAKTNEEDLT